MKAKAVFFDIDNTLVRNSIGHKDTFIEAIMDVFGFDAKMKYSSYTGKIDKQILIEVLKKHNISDSEIDAGVDECIERMREIYKLKARQKLANADMIEGADKTLEILKSKGLTIGLLTGNIKIIAYEKLRLAGLNNFKFLEGGFGDEGTSRSEIAKKAMQKIKEHKNIEPFEVVITGDTPIDILAAKSVGAHAYGVSTGNFSNKELQDAGAEFVTSNILDLTKVLK